MATTELAEALRNGQIKAIASDRTRLMGYQATITGWRSNSDGTREQRPMPKPKAQIHEVICAGVAPKLWAA